MATWEFKLPDIGEGVVEGEIVKWLVKEGDAIKEDQPMVEVMTDKATVTIPSPRRGTVKRTFGKEGEIAKVHHALVLLEVDGAGTPDVPAAKASAPRAAAAAAPATNGHAAPAAAAAAGAKVLATPVTRRMAREHGLDLSSVAGSGPQGRVTKADVEAHLAGGGAKTNGAATGAPLAPLAPLASARGDQRVPIRGLRKKIAE
ncbi:MAG: E3 binding domain-containing protein, partial [Myxococcaceae bacterium]|nr:E3 binding domain-containing protein [Myxococcaceae bacterium]